MSINLVRNLVFRNYCKSSLSLRSALFRNAIEYKKAQSVCKCSTFINITSKQCLLTDEKSKNAIGFGLSRFFSEEKSGPPSNKLPQLMPEFPKLVWPSLIKSIRNFILATFIIKPYLDREFNLPDFVAGSKKAVEVISKKLSDGDIKSLEGLVTNDIIPALQKTLSLMSLSQREQIATNMDDIYFSFPYQVGIIFNDEEGKDQKRFVEITMVYHSMKGLSNMRSRGEEPPLNMGMLPEYQQKIFICNYRFIREFTKGVDSDWTVNLLNHFKPVDES